eukprot:SAG22_NODE_815_length_7037_cov_6.192130_7_plen_587_part_00
MSCPAACGLTRRPPVWTHGRYSSRQAEQKLELARTASQQEFATKWEATVKPLLAAGKLREAELQNELDQARAELSELRARCTASDSVMRGFKEAADARVQDSEDESERLRAAIGTMKWHHAQKMAQKDGEVQAARAEVEASQRRRGILPPHENGIGAAPITSLSAVAAAASAQSRLSAEELAELDERKRQLSEQRASDSLVAEQQRTEFEFEDDAIRAEDAEDAGDGPADAGAAAEADGDDAGLMELAAEQLTDCNARIEAQLEALRGGQDDDELEALRRSVAEQQQQSTWAATRIQSAHRGQAARREHGIQMEFRRHRQAQEDGDGEEGGQASGWTDYAELLDAPDSAAARETAAARGQTAPPGVPLDDFPAQTAAEAVAAAGGRRGTSAGAVSHTAPFAEHQASGSQQPRRPTSAAPRRRGAAERGVPNRKPRCRPQSAPAKRRDAFRSAAAAEAQPTFHAAVGTRPAGAGPGGNAAGAFTTKLPMRSAQASFGGRGKRDRERRAGATAAASGGRDRERERRVLAVVNLSSSESMFLSESIAASAAEQPPPAALEFSGVWATRGQRRNSAAGAARVSGLGMSSR